VMSVATAGHGKPCPYQLEGKRAQHAAPLQGEEGWRASGQNGDSKGAKLAATHVRKKQDGGPEARRYEKPYVKAD